jgi:hypothetical protein
MHLCPFASWLIFIFLWSRIHSKISTRDVLSINNDLFHSYVDSIYPSELEIKDTTKSPTSASYLDVLLNIDAGRKLTTQLYDQRDDSVLPLSTSHILVATSHYHLHKAYISLNWFNTRACSTHDQCLSRGRLPTDKLMLQGFLQSRLVSAFCKLYGGLNLN